MFTNIEMLDREDSDLFGIRKLDFRHRVPESAEIFTDEEARIYIEGCDFPESVDDLLLAWEIEHQFGNIKQMQIMDAMSGPGRLGRELLGLDAQHVTFHDGHHIMLNHSTKWAAKLFHQEQFSSILSPVDNIASENDRFDLVVCHNSTHQLDSESKLQKALAEFVRVTKPGGFVLIADYQRNDSIEFLEALEERMLFTKEQIRPLLLPTFQAAFSKAEFETAVKAIPGINSWSITDAIFPELSPIQKERLSLDPVLGHVLDFSRISQRILIQKEIL